MSKSMAGRPLLRNRMPLQPALWNVALLLGVIGIVVHLSVHHYFDYLYVQGIYLHLALWLGSAVAIARRPSAVPSSSSSPTAET